MCRLTVVTVCIVALIVLSSLVEIQSSLAWMFFGWGVPYTCSTLLSTGRCMFLFPKSVKFPSRGYWLVSQWFERWIVQMQVAADICSQRLFKFRAYNITNAMHQVHAKWMAVLDMRGDLRLHLQYVQQANTNKLRIMQECDISCAIWQHTKADMSDVENGAWNELERDYL